MTKNYFISGIIPEQKKKLTETGIAFVDFEIDGAKGVVVEDGDVNKTVTKGIFSLVAGTETKTSYEGIVKISVVWQPMVGDQESEKKFQVIVGHWDGRNKSDFVKVAEEFLPAIKRNIIIDVPHRSTVKPSMEDGQLYIWIWSQVSNQQERKDVPAKMWGISVDCRDQGYQPSGLGIPIAEDSGYVVAELVSNNLYIHHDLCDYGSNEELAIFRRVLEEVVAERNLSPKEKEERERKRGIERRRRSREAYAKECSLRFQKTVKGTEESISNGKLEIEKLQKSLVKKIRETHGAERKLEQLLATKGDQMEKYGQEFDKLLFVRGVRDVQAADGVIKIFTEILYCVDPRDKMRHEIGAFRIEIYTNASNNGVRWFNLTRRVDAYNDGMQAPHIYNDGHACLGNTQEIFPELIGNYEFAAAAMVAIQFVESVNADDTAGKHINKWPEAPLIAEVK